MEIIFAVYLILRKLILRLKPNSQTSQNFLNRKIFRFYSIRYIYIYIRTANIKTSLKYCIEYCALIKRKDQKFDTYLFV